MGKWFLDFSFWTRGYRTAQTAHCAMVMPLYCQDVSSEPPREAHNPLEWNRLRSRYETGEIQF